MVVYRVKYIACKMRGLTLYIRVFFIFFPRYKIEPVSNMIPFAPGQAMGKDQWTKSQINGRLVTLNVF